MSQDIETMTAEEIIEIEKTPQDLKKEYEEQLQTAVAKYKKASAKLEFAFDPFEEDCIKDEMAMFKSEVKELRAKIDALAL